MNLQVLLVDDDKMILFIHKILINNSIIQSQPLTFTSGREVFTYLKNDYNKKTSYLIMLDLNMPEMNGWEFLENMTNGKALDNVFVVIVTSSINSEDKRRAFSFPRVIDYIEKPLSGNWCDKLFEKLKREIPLD
ncbi:MAG TPA: response regulator [Salinimicrobium sp.]|nr:response regulator [Salinimicrobium sp.]